RGGQTFVMADIPALIEGAAEGLGLGHEFLRHVRRTKVLIHVLDTSGGLEGRDPLEDFRTINNELYSFDDEMREKPMIVALNKVDLVEGRENLPRLKETLLAEGFRTFEISAATGEGIPPLLNTVAADLHEIYLLEEEARNNAAERPKRRVYTIGNINDRAWDSDRSSPHHWVISGIGIERFAKMTNFDQWQSADRFQRVLDRAGILKELRRQGIQDEDTVHVADFEMMWGDQYADESKSYDQRRPSAVRRSSGNLAVDEAEEIDLEYDPDELEFNEEEMTFSISLDQKN
ncbi:MAG: Obg family GTPase CgtA, partial [Thermomicrobiales bacterium]